jgi:hypothetical protein
LHRGKLPAIPVLSLDQSAGFDEDGELTLADTLVAPTPVLISSEPDHTALYQMIDVLPDGQRETVLRHYGLGDHAPEKLSEVGQQLKELGVLTYSPYKYHSSALSNLRQILGSTTLSGGEILPEHLTEKLRQDGEHYKQVQYVGPVARARRIFAAHPKMGTTELARAAECDLAIASRVRKEAREKGHPDAKRVEVQA